MKQSNNLQYLMDWTGITKIRQIQKNYRRNLARKVSLA
jgi:hypothetical protein